MQSGQFVVSTGFVIVCICVYSPAWLMAIESPVWRMATECQCGVAASVICGLT